MEIKDTSSKKRFTLGCLLGGCIAPILLIGAVLAYIWFSALKSSNQTAEVPIVEMGPDTTKDNGTFSLKYLSAFTTTRSNNPDVIKDYMLKDGEVLITVAFQFENITEKNYKPEGSADDFSLKSPTGSEYTAENNGFLYECCVSNQNEKDLGFGFVPAGYIGMGDFPPGVKNNYLAAFVVSQKEFESSSENWIVTIPLNGPFIISIPKEKMYPMSNWLEFDALVKGALGMFEKK